jgi:opacity protein-like surface antigen
LNFLPISPYVLAGGGYARTTASANLDSASASNSVSGQYFGVGAGASIKAGKHWGLRPEVRWERQFYSAGGQNDVRGLVSLYYHFGLNPLPHP